MSVVNSNNDNSNDVDVLEQQENEKRKKKRFAIIGAVSISALILGGLVLFTADVGDSIKRTMGADKVQEDTYIHSQNMDDEEKNESVDALAEVSEITATIPIDVPDYLQTHYNPSTPGLRDRLFERYVGTQISSQTVGLNNESDGYHMGGPMDDFQVTITREEVVAATGEYIERLVNPTFGGWAESQFSVGNANEEFPLGKLEDMFTKDFLSRNAAKEYKDYVPVYADWNSDNYGMDNLSNVYRWHGEIVNIQSEFENSPSGELDLIVSVDVLFQTWDNSGEKITKEGILDLKIVQGDEAERPVLIDNAILTIK